ncbi:CGH_1_collapsed_G0026820.mRNA.1.CDS.1 [Saccharomyces cerevisiae]|nr:CGH_1_HP_G0058290.mRNA.1.CDS.1 [Saccharomyces cerevisiae]CAI4983364.1 CGH_1_HP_G0061310.mRNA.1.CDS.1 [Saccharomyces cerevisiae]CAI6810831.1 CGH_1_HP_G0058290.mRNA.1.CDS.1 [Saccharomyces cerevisiae]CAI6833571.1 CGH_1_HP_G0061310.mRNA.1.CDS.1 [Saccharomyces cerevisiae]CAI7237048.1 CGH_3_collapsed_G0026140.mRNA.1.CDS.1 [Saccharomyces cerevisiae]
MVALGSTTSKGKQNGARNFRALAVMQTLTTPSGSNSNIHSYVLGTFCFGVYSLVKINKFFKTDQTVDLNRLLELFFWQLNAILNMKLFAFYGDHLESHSAPLDVYEDSFANKSSSGGDEV